MAAYHLPSAARSNSSTLAGRFGATCRRLAKHRPVLGHASTGSIRELEQALLVEELAERRRDKEYWLPFRRELAELRHRR
jgi:hypothetical protein